MIQPQNRADDTELARQARAGSMQAFEELVFRYEKPLYGFLRGKTGDPSSAEDLVQQVFIKAYRNIGRYSPRYAFRTWLYTIARREAASHYRAARAPAAEWTEELQADHRTPAHALAEQEKSDQLWRTARRVLPESQFTAVWLVYHDGLSVKETAQVMKRTTGGVKVLLHRARGKLLEALRPAADPAACGENSKEENPCIVS